MTAIRQAILDFHRKQKTHEKARLYEQKKRTEMAKARDDLMRKLGRGNLVIIPLDGQLCVVELGNNGLSIKPARFVNE